MNGERDITKQTCVWCMEATRDVKQSNQRSLENHVGSMHEGTIRPLANHMPFCQGHAGVWGLHGVMGGCLLAFLTQERYTFSTQTHGSSPVTQMSPKVIKMDPKTLQIDSLSVKCL